MLAGCDAKPIFIHYNIKSREIASICIKDSAGNVKSSADKGRGFLKNPVLYFIMDINCFYRKETLERGGNYAA